MKLKFKRLIGMILALSMMLTLLPTAAFAADPDTEPVATYDNCGADGSNVTAVLTKNSDETYFQCYTLTIHGTGAMADYDVYSGQSVPWSQYNGNITQVVIQNGITRIGSCSFINHINLKAVTLPESVTKIGIGAFAGCQALASIKLPDSLIEIGEQAFATSSLASVTIPQNVEYIGSSAFASYALDTIKVSAGNSHFYVDDNVLYEKTSAGNVLLQCPAARTTALTIPNNVVKINDYAFAYCLSLPGVTISNSVVNIGNQAFASCQNLKNIIIPDSVTSIGDQAFSGCTSLEEITIPDSVTSLGQAVFNVCHSLTSITIPDSMTSIPFGAFYDCEALTSITIPNSITSIEEQAFGSCRKLNAINYTGSKSQWDALKPNISATGNSSLTEITPTYEAVDVTVTTPGRTVTAKADGKTAAITNGSFVVPKGKSVELTISDSQEGETYQWIVNNGVPVNTSTPHYTFTAVESDDPMTVVLTVINPAPVVKHTLNVLGGTITNAVLGSKTLDDAIGKSKASIPEGAIVTVTYDDSALKDSGSVFDQWKIKTNSELLLPTEDAANKMTADPKSNPITFVMPTDDVELEAMTRDASIDPAVEEILGIGGAAIAGAAGAAVVGYTAYQIGTELAGIYYGLPYFPSNRTALALMLWQDAGQPMPKSSLLYPDMGQEEQDMDLQHAARWAMENELLPDKNDEGTAPEEMKFYPDDAVSKVNVLKAWKKAQDLKNN